MKPKHCSFCFVLAGILIFLSGSPALAQKVSKAVKQADDVQRETPAQVRKQPATSAYTVPADDGGRVQVQKPAVQQPETKQSPNTKQESGAKQKKKGNGPMSPQSGGGASIVITGGTTLGIKSGTALSVPGNLTNNGTLTTASGASVIFPWPGNKVMSGIASLNTLKVTGGDTVTIANPLTVTDTLSIVSGTIVTGSTSIFVTNNRSDAVVIPSDGSISGTIRRLIAPTSAQPPVAGVNSYLFTGRRTFVTPAASQPADTLTITSHPGIAASPLTPGPSVERYYEIASSVPGYSALELALEYAAPENPDIDLSHMALLRNANQTGSSWVSMGGGVLPGTYGANCVVGPVSVWAGNWTIGDLTSPLPNIYVGNDATGAGAGVFYPGVSWGGGYPGRTNDWSWKTGTRAFSVYVVPQPGTRFNDCSVTLTWDAAKVSYVSTSFGSAGTGGSPNGIFGTGHLYSTTQSFTHTDPNVTITGHRVDANFTPQSGDYIARVDFTLLNPGSPSITVSGSTFNRMSPSVGVAVMAQAGQVKAFLGDVATSATNDTTGDGLVNFEDLVVWSNSYWSGVGSVGMANYKAKYDIGPTADGYVFTLPQQDGKVDFEDLIIFSISYGLSHSNALPKIPLPSKDPVVVSLGRPVAAGNETRIPLMVDGGFTEIRGMKIQLDGLFGTFVGADKGDLLKAYDTPVAILSKTEGRNVFVDLAVMGLNAPGLAQAGSVVWLRFTGRTFVKLDKVEARSSYNTTLPLQKKQGEGESPPAEFALHQNYPNPFNPSTTIEYEVPAMGPVTLVVYNILGERIVTLANEVKDAGFYKVVWHGRNDANEQAASGMYLIRMVARDYKCVKKMLLVK